MTNTRYAEYLPFVIKRWEYVKSPLNPESPMWDYIGWPPNRGERRDIPSTALFHHSVISRMRLSPDPENHRPKHYVPDNELWVQASGAHHPERTKLSELANQYGLEDDADRDNGTQRLLKPRKPRIHFEHAKDLTTGSVAKKGETGVVRAEKWDRIYRVALEVN